MHNQEIIFVDKRSEVQTMYWLLLLLFSVSRIVECAETVVRIRPVVVPARDGISTTRCAIAVTSSGTRVCPVRSAGRPIDTLPRRKWSSAWTARGEWVTKIDNVSAPVKKLRELDSIQKDQLMFQWKKVVLGSLVIKDMCLIQMKESRTLTKYSRSHLQRENAAK